LKKGKTPSLKIFNLEYIEKELEKLDRVLERPLKIYVAGGFVISTNRLKAGTKDIDVIVDTRTQSKILGDSLEKSGYKHLSLGSVTQDNRDLSAELYENFDEFRWDVFIKVVAHKLALSKSMKSRAKLTHRKKNLLLFELSKEDIFLMKGVTERERDLEDMSLIARSGIDYKIVLEECLHQSETTGTIWETGLKDTCQELGEKFGINVPILRKLRKIGEEKMLMKFVRDSLVNGAKTSDQIFEELKLKGKIRKSEINEGIKLLKGRGEIRITKSGKIRTLKKPRNIPV
jgi:hypothetical protein